MSYRRERCGNCGVELQFPLDAKSVRCAACHAITTVRTRDPVKQAANWIKGFVNHVAYNAINSLSSSSSSPLWASEPYTYQSLRPPTYPQVHGKKRALLCGVSYRQRWNELKGTINDVNCMKYLLCDRFGFSPNSILMLTEDERDPYRIPTKQNMRTAMRWLVQDCQPGDSLVFHYSGHGSQQRDSSGDEIDGYDETLCPLDYETVGMIVDDEINETIVRPLPEGVKLHAIVDACHSGTVLDLPFLCRVNRYGYYQWENHNPPSGAYKGTSGGEAVSFSGCDDHQKSSDTSALSEGTNTGTMTYCFIQALLTGSGTTYGSLLNAMRSAIRGAHSGLIGGNGPLTCLLKRVLWEGMKQEPQLTSSKQFDIYRTPFCL
ncbi:metacaspase-1 isoform X1 [Amborella trichopoda]|uniref:Uncharacterized protein n=1 Tax=Amborella trichopoda TaxID=13333 RepID=U5CXH3_AMBTC|nr:metacaspase-1 isoform X1 [Amborella trichopoda]ERN14650.1 hypothetical protein AMTR_s00038p00201610 [Amborella trichopoda]|eukprot:XP_006853183.1 metacaspase-1 isoform X1 [Amborella trichopoda]